MIVSYLPDAQLRNLKVTVRDAHVDLSEAEPISLTLPGACTFEQLKQVLISLDHVSLNRHHNIELTIRVPIFDEDGKTIILDEHGSETKPTELIGRTHLDENGFQHVDFAITGFRRFAFLRGI